MATLTEVSTITRKIVLWGTIFLVVIMLIPPAFRLGRSIYLTLRPTPPPPPTARYGKLPNLYFPVKQRLYQPMLKLELKEGNLPADLPNVAKVYFVEINKTRLLELERIKTKVRALGFTTEPEKLDDRTYKFIHPTLPASMLVDIISSNFSYTYDWVQDPEIFTGKTLLSKEQAILEAKTFLQSMSVLEKDLVDADTKVTLLRRDGTNLVPAASQSETEFIKIDMFRSPIDTSWKFTSANAPDASVSFLIASTGNFQKRIVSVNFAYSKVNLEQFETYYLKSVDTAWQKLLANDPDTFIAAGDLPNVSVRKVTLAYFESHIPQQFLQPVYVFEGDGGFIGIVSAIDSQYQE